MDIETSAAIIVGLRTIGKPAAELVKDFLARVMGKPADAIGDVMADPVIAWRERRAARMHALVTGGASIAQASGLEPHEVPPSLLLPLLEKGSLVDDADLQALWTQLLASAATQLPDDVPPSFPQILSELSAAEAKLLMWIFEQAQPEPDLNLGYRLNVSQYYEQNGAEQDFRTATMEDNLVRLGILRRHSEPHVRGRDLQRLLPQLADKRTYFPDDVVVRDDADDSLILTPLGISFLRACAGPLRTPAESST